MTVYIKGRLFCWCEIKRLLVFAIILQIVSRILPPCNVTLTHWHVKWELQRKRKESQRGRDERWEMERRGQREGEIENTLEKFAERYHKWHRQFLWKNYFIIISIPKRIERKALKEEGQVTLRGIRGNAYPPHTHAHARTLSEYGSVQFHVFMKIKNVILIMSYSIICIQPLCLCLFWCYICVKCLEPVTELKIYNLLVWLLLLPASSNQSFI